MQESVVIDVALVASALDEKLKNAGVSVQPSNCIFETPSILLRHSENSFRPNSFSIGPIHHGKENLVAAEEIKIKYLKGLLSRVIKNRRLETMSEEEEKMEQWRTLTGWIKSVKLIEKEASACYAGHDFAGDKFVEIMVLDGCFIIELFRKHDPQVVDEEDDDWLEKKKDDNLRPEDEGKALHLSFKERCLSLTLRNWVLKLLSLMANKKSKTKKKKKENDDLWLEKKEDDDPILSMSCMLKFLHHDLILLENQVPWSVLQTLFDQTKLRSETKSLIELTLDFFDTVFTSKPPGHPKKITKYICSRQDIKIKHILDLLWWTQVLPSQEIQGRTISHWTQIHSLTRLREAGVKFKKANADSILDIKFTNGCLEIPSLLIQETTDTILRNLIAYEQCLPGRRPIFTCYAKLLDNLIDTTNDIHILCKRDIFVNWLSPEDATQFFNKLYNDTYFKEFCYRELCRKLDQHCKSWWRRWRAYYVHNYFSKPWAIIAQIYAVIILFFTIWQSFIKN